MPTGNAHPHQTAAQRARIAAAAANAAAAKRTDDMMAAAAKRGSTRTAGKPGAIGKTVPGTATYPHTIGPKASTRSNGNSCLRRAGKTIARALGCGSRRRGRKNMTRRRR